MAKKFGVSPLTNRIYYGNVNEEKHMFTGKKEDVTDDAIRAVFEWFIGNIESDKTSKEFKVAYSSTDYELVMRKANNEK